MKGLTPEQLLMLADRAERGPLTPTETAALRVGITQLADQARQSAATAEGLRNRVRELRTKTARAERDAALADPLKTPCPYCHAPAGHRCRPMRGIQPPPTPHAARLNAARAAA